MSTIILFRTVFATIIIAYFLGTICEAGNIQFSESNNTQKTSPQSSRLSVDICQKCHNNIVTLVLLFGKSHNSKVTCLSCHEGHPPTTRDIIPRCSKCHYGTDHFLLTKCQVCHTNPHAPLQITLSRDITFPCTTCHTKQIKELRENLSSHSTLDCTACHTKHGLLPKCSACHNSHLEGMGQKDCLSCHKPHMPLLVLYGRNIPSEYCGSCHSTVYSELGESHAKHRELACTLCHEKNHKMIPKCQNCHDLPHSENIHRKFNSCSICHGAAHNLKLNEIEMLLENISSGQEGK